ncbi:hypothetical protein POM88_020418 [Heracleum sosnowskyi]|uniref:Uncharacterized protein n=1 Tax=Heracleum sosnowskyi TaxID=360622 RepID=A0AAD8MSV1_9APIA|nr:hypothetical protein POM88_020418 [Heracleum sosnowskyi]
MLIDLQNALRVRFYKQVHEKCNIHCFSLYDWSYPISPWQATIEYESIWKFIASIRQIIIIYENLGFHVKQDPYSQTQLKFGISKASELNTLKEKVSFERDHVKYLHDYTHVKIQAGCKVP